MTFTLSLFDSGSQLNVKKTIDFSLKKKKKNHQTYLSVFKIESEQILGLFPGKNKQKNSPRPIKE